LTKHHKQDPYFLGREGDLAELQARLSAGDRWITIAGPPGVGKTTLARRIHKEWPGARWCDLASATPEDLDPHLSDALRFESTSGVTDRLQGMGSILFVLDNAEHLRDLLRPRLEAWIEVVGALQIVVTSRVRINSQREHIHELAPLGEEATLLFHDRAGRVGAKLGPVGSNPEVRSIVELLDGMPLSLELAASRLSVLSPTQLRERLERDLLSLRGAPGMFPDRHRKLAATLELSFSLLTPTAADAVNVLSALPDGFSVHSAASILDIDEYDAEDLVHELRANSLLRVDDADGRRFRFFFSVREFAADRNLRPEENRVRLEAWASDLAQRWWAAEVRQCGDRPDVRPERYNLLFCAALLSDAGRVDDACAVLCSLAPQLSKYVNPEFSRLLSVVSGAAGPRDDDLHAGVLAHRATQSRIAGNPTEAVDWAQRAVQRARINNNLSVLALARHKLAVGLWRTGELERALELFEWSAEARAKLGQTTYEVSSRGGVAILHHAAGRLDRAEAAYAATIEAGRSCPDAAGPVATALSNLAHLHWDLGRHDDARAGLQASIDLASANDMDRYAAIVRLELARLRIVLGELDAGENQLIEATAQIRASAGTMERALARGIHGILALRRGEVDRAESETREGTALARLANDHETLCVALMWRGTVLAMADRADEADAVFDQAQALIGRVSRPGFDYALAVHRCQAMVANGAHEAARETAADIIAGAGVHGDHGEVHAATVVLHDAIRFRIEAGAADGDSLLLPADANWFQLGDGARVVLKRRRAPRYILARLAQHRVLAPGQGLSLWDLAEAGWPGEELHPDVASNRVYVALATLRKLGLESALVRRGGGYAIAPELNVVLLADSDSVAAP
jgi:predicted ATPase